MPSSPSAPISGHRSRGNWFSRSIASARGAMRSCAKSWTLLRSISTSGPRPKSKPAQALGIIALIAADSTGLRSGCQRPGRRGAARLGLHFVLRQQAVDRFGRRRPREQEALHLVAAGESQQDALLLGFDALDHHREAKRTPERHDRLDDHPAIGKIVERNHEAAVDLEFVEWKTLEITQIGITGAKIVQRNRYAEPM